MSMFGELGSVAASSSLEQKVDIGLLREKTLYQLKVLLAEFTKLSISKIVSDEPLESYGIDSIMITQLNEKFASIFGEVSKTLLYEYQTLGVLVEYFISDYPQECMKWTGLIEPVPSTPEKKPDVVPFHSEFPVLPSFKERKHLVRSLTAVASSSDGSRDSIAIIGMSGCYPQAKKLKEYWGNLQSGVDCIIEIPKERWSLEEFYYSDQQEAIARGKSYSKWGGFVEGFADFDPLFFNISPRETLNMDPQERLFIESCWEVFEDAGYTKDELKVKYNGRIGVFAGITKTGFDLYGPDLWKQGKKDFPHTSFSSVANRVSYLLNLQGPSMAVDTMCSSSLTAIHEACEYLHRKECEMAIAGGVNLYVHPSSYNGLCAQQMLSADGQCKSFGQGGNGFVPGEGVGTILLKRLSQAIIDEDHIYAVIRGTSINHDGKTNGYTVPNPTAQGDVIRKAMDKAGVNARTISYIEAHGTGTELGDPIEITGLTQAFRKDTQDTGYCAIGSVKANIGHLEAAAGIAGVTKIVLQMQHQKLVPSLHTKKLNPNINFKNTPFVVQQELAEWKRPKIEINGEIREYPRIAGISSFGAGGSNAHVVIEEYMDKDEQPSSIRITKQNPAIIVLSAKNEQRLKEQVQQMVAAIQQQQISDENLANMAYTLQVGREAMEERVAVLVGSSKELEEKLKGFLADQDGIEDLYRGQVKRNKDTMAIFAADDEMQEILKKWIAHRKYGKLLDLWVKGMIYDWQKLYNDSKPRRISLPTYPFAKERYWVPEAGIAASSNIISPVTAGLLHPLLHQNTSDFSEQRFSSTFTGQEFFLADHVVKGQRVLPGVAYLEMARAAVEQAAGVLAEDKIGIRLKNVVWVRPVAALGQPVQVHIGLYPEENGEIAYEIYSDSETVDREPIIHSQGSVVLRSVTETPRVDLKSLQAECGQSTFTSSQCYEAFRTMGLAYGSSHQGIEVVYTGQEQVLAKLRLPASVSNTHNQFTLHPSLMDAALQATIGFMLVTGVTGSEASLKPVLPFALQELEILSNCPSVMWALLRYSAGSRAGDKVQKFDIDLCDEQGNVCVRIKGFSLRVLEREVGSVGKIGNNEMLLLEPYWKEQASILETMDSAYVQHVVMLCELSEAYRESVETCMDTIRCVTLQIEKESIEERFQAYAVQVFEEIQTILKNKQKGKVLIQVVVPTQEERQLFSGLLGLLKTAQLENPKIIGQMIEVEVEGLSQEIIEILKENSQSSIDNHVRYQGGTRWVNGWREVAVTEEISLPWKDNGVYLITGGAGGLGLIFAQEIAHTVKNATLILTGRSVLDEGKQEKIKAIETLGAFVEYRKVDVADKQAVGDLIQSIQEKFGSLSGIIHSAGVIRDKFMIQKTKEEMQEVLTPKVTGLVNLDHASKEMNLDFFLLFSSMAGSLGNVGQADYSTANAFMDGYARYRNDMVVSKQRYGQTLSINWPLWKDGGMHVDKEAEKAMQGMGMIAMETPIGIQALYQGLVACKDQVMVIEGDVMKLRSFLGLDLIEFDEVDNEFFQSLFEQITKGELSEEQFESLALTRRGR
ncbi:type I polyketide synthase [Pelosinus fermentans]|uniref:6-deoxyerythronolide-B synthase, 3-oxoacyl-(Acyl-carrier-protein) reductase n=1 Tax=Pelosinus fermentans JBW45 TaxID=1192197 RepID=A0A0C5Q0M9_9FIRM|nr:type I polyketide synthase [Pelosinus fermentans]AJQ25405.1 6-deoxyerythronolide-B synthase, 3-oxoacyl-(acyl-carrier-protein) reductase [Pelosinus fermentans JBW45]